jgi:hypothetical protein
MRRAALALAVLLAGCDAFLGGEAAARIPLQPAAEGGCAPLRILLQPQMNPVVFDFHAAFAWGNRQEAGQWNEYRATLSAGGRVIQAQQFTANSLEPDKSAGGDSPAPNVLRRTMLRLDVPGEDEYELAIVPLGPEAVTLREPQVVLRINVPRLPSFRADPG